MANFLDKTIKIISPKWAFQRAQNTLKIDLLDVEKRKYDAASRGRRTDGWHSTGSSANAEMWGTLPTLRNRARELYRNSGYAFRAINVIVSNTIGTGIKPTPKGNARAVKRAKDAWEKWAESTEIDQSGMMDFYAIQALVMRTVAMSGECLIRKHRLNSKENKSVPLQLQIMEGDYLDHSHDQSVDADGNFVIHGVKMNKKGQRVGYWLWDRHPGDVVRIDALTSNLIPADEVIHVYRIERPGQIRGIPFGVSGMLKIKDFDDYEDAQLIRQKIAACFALFVTDSNDVIAPSTGITNRIERIEPGTIEYLDPNKQITMAEPPGTEGYAEYTRKMLQGIASSYGVTYEAMTGDLSNVNFSSGRMGWLEAHRLISEWQTQMIIPMFCLKVWDSFLEAAVIAGLIPTNEIPANWTPPRREMIDPVKEVNGLKEQVRAGFMSWQEAVRTLGYDPDTVLVQLKDDFEKLAEFGLMLTVDPRYDPARKPGLENNEEGTETVTAPAAPAKTK